MDPAPTLGRTPALLEHSKEVWHAMYDESQPGEVDSDTYQIYRGFLTKLFSKVRLSTPYYSSVMQTLKKMDCVRQLRRGGGGSPSEWALIQEPTVALFMQTANNPTPINPRKASGNTQQLLQMIKDLTARVIVLEDMLLTPAEEAVSE